MEKTLNTNQLHSREHLHPSGRRTFSTIEGSIMLKNGNTKNITQKEAKLLFEQVEKGDFLGKIDVLIEFKTEKQGMKLAKQFSRLADNPAVQLNVQFQKISDAKN